MTLLDFLTSTLAFQILKWVTIAFVALLYATLIIWTVRDARSRSRNRTVWILGGLLVLVFNVFGMVVYMILRPTLTLEEKANLELESRLLAGEDSDANMHTCTQCGKRVMKSYAFCPFCAKQYKKPCTKCGALLDLKWKHCPVCGTRNAPESR